MAVVQGPWAEKTEARTAHCFACHENFEVELEPRAPMYGIHCPSCGLEYGVASKMRTPIAARPCACGCLVFFVVPDGPCCASCGDVQTQWVEGE